MTHEIHCCEKKICIRVNILRSYHTEIVKILRLYFQSFTNIHGEHKTLYILLLKKYGRSVSGNIIFLSVE